MTARILSPDGARFEVIGASPPKPQNPNKGVSNLVVTLPEKVTATRIVVVLAGKETTVSMPEPLDAWK